MELQALTSTNFYFKNQTAFYRGKVRDVYTINQDVLVIVACDRISAFDHVLPRSIPFKGQVLNAVASMFLDQTQNIMPNWKLSTPDAHVTIGKRCDAIPIEFVVRNYLTGHAWRVYKEGGRVLCGNTLPEGLKENDKLPAPIITPATKAVSGHDEDISYSEIINQNILSKSRLDELCDNALSLFELGTKYAASKNLILVDTKYEFGLFNNEATLIDEIHTPDSSRFFYGDTYEKLQNEGKQQRQLSKEFVREWLIQNNFMGKEGQKVPHMSAEWIDTISKRYIELYEQVIGEKFIPQQLSEEETYQLVCASLEKLT